jgi:hypothetical protein
VKVLGESKHWLKDFDPAAATASMQTTIGPASNLAKRPLAYATITAGRNSPSLLIAWNDMKKILIVTLAASTLQACTSVNVKKVDASVHAMNLVCIEENPKVIVSDMLNVLEDGFQRHNIRTLIYRDKAPEHCEYTLWYTATRGWDLAPFLNNSELRLRRNGETIASATYKHSGGLALNKWASTSTKMTPVIDELLSGFGGKAAGTN